MNKHPGKRMTAAVTVLAVGAALAGCASLKSDKPSTSPVYLCDQGLRFEVRFVNDTAMVKGGRGDDVLLRDAGGQGRQTVYTNPRLRAEFGLGASGREAVLQYLLQPLVVRCVQQ